MNKDKIWIVVVIIIVATLMGLSFIPKKEATMCTGVRTKDFSYFEMTKKELIQEMGEIAELKDYPQEQQIAAKKNSGYVNTPEGVLNLTHTVYNLECK